MIQFTFLFPLCINSSFTSYHFLYLLYFYLLSKIAFLFSDMCDIVAVPVISGEDNLVIFEDSTDAFQGLSLSEAGSCKAAVQRLNLSQYSHENI